MLTQNLPDVSGNDVGDHQPRDLVGGFEG